MVDVNDPSGIEHKLARRWQQLHEADIAAADHDAIEAFVEHRRDIEERARTTLKTDLSTLRCASERAAVPLTDMELADVQQLMRTLTQPKSAGGYGLERGGSGMFDYKRALRVFFKWLDQSPDFGTYDFGEDIELPDREPAGAAGEGEMLTADDVAALRDAANHPRDAALIDLLADIGGRITFVLSLRRQDVHLDGSEPYITPNDAVFDGLKNLDSEEIPILYSRAELRSFVNRHHPDKRPEAPLWPVLVGYDYDDPQACALGDDRARTLLKECADRAGVDKRVEPHNFRRTAATRMSNTDRLNPQEIQQILGWADDRMLEVYDKTTESRRNSEIHQALGFSDGDESDGTDDMSPIVCGNCRETNGPTQRFCGNCGIGLDESAESARSDLESGATRAQFDATDLDASRRMEIAEDWARENPEKAVDVFFDAANR